MIYPQVTDFPRLTASEEANVILRDVFQFDALGMDAMLHQLCADDGIAFDWDANGDEIDSLIIDNEDELISMYQSYLKVEGVAFAADEEPETDEDEDEDEDEEDETDEEDENEEEIQF